MLNATLLDCQKRVVDYMLDHPYCINASEMGTGKTIESIYCIAKLNKKTLIVCPSYLRQNWESELIKFLKEPKKIVIFKSSKDLLSFRGEFDVGIIGYSLLKHSARLFSRCSYVVADEAHYLKNIDSERSKIFHSFVQVSKPSHLQLLTGTPIKNDVAEYYSLLRLLCYRKDRIKGKDFLQEFKTIYKFQNYFQYKKQFKIHGRRITQYEGLKPEKKSILKSYLEGKIIRVPYSEVSKDSGKTFEDKYVVVKYKDDKKLEKEWAAFNDKGHKMSHTFTAKKDNAVKKAKFTAEYIKDVYEQTKYPVVVFSDHIQPLLDIKKKHSKAEIIQGSVDSDKRHEIVKRFQEGEIPYLLLTIGAGSTGFTLTRSHHCVFNDESWIPADNAQARGRVNRIGQDKFVVYHVICGSKVDEKISKTLKKKQEVIAEVSI